MVPEVEEFEAEIESYDYVSEEVEYDSCKSVKSCHTDWDCKTHETTRVGRVIKWEPVFGSREFTFEDMNVTTV